ncbi:MAG: carbohydrate binding family 9 domain-containing protein, partial [Gemmatimonadota bacterium]|nr:carbohydrate binding family 9 domain-containing protein [Gemmatimonadota bacterium]
MLTAISAIVAAALSVSQQQQPASAQPIASATAVLAEQVPAIDGRDEDAVWQRAPRYSQFRQFEPKVDVDPSFRTEFRAAYDEKNLYVFVRMFDPRPDSIMRALSRRDVRGPSDQIKLLIDSYNDRRSGFEFAVNPDGVKRDYSMSYDGNEDESWNGVWD